MGAGSPRPVLQAGLCRVLVGQGPEMGPRERWEGGEELSLGPGRPLPLRQGFKAGLCDSLLGR